ncbi:hypothetical protein LJC18_02050 [Lachnospiraceae bacterium OttesenSCG-928-E19]|nr:hypothetical protein [Lachnospiraceae bacterium OttesenSCG-928-E19]
MNYGADRMSFLKKTIGFMVVTALIPAAFGVTARPSIISQVGTRMPTMTGRLNNGTGTNTNGTTTQTAAEKDQECIEAYTDCLKGGDVCGSSFEECTTKTLFYAKRPMCTSTLLQCSANAVTSLFGTNNQTSFANKDSNGEYVYPTDGSILGQMIEAAHINNRYDTSQCVRNVTRCLQKSDVCGSDFELCTSNTEFKKQKLFCESTIARCMDEGKRELFGTTNTSANPSANSRLGIMITEGAALAAVNAVATCYKVADQCILNTCAANPYKCKEGASTTLVNVAQDVTVDDGTTTTTTTTTTDYTGVVNRSEISGFVKNNCLDTIGGNKFCYATFIGNGAMPTASQLKDEDNKEEIFAEAYSARMNDSMRVKLDELIEKFDKRVKNRCQDTIVNCAMRTCGGGNGAACYASAFASNNTIKGVANPGTKSTIKYGCEAIVNNDTSCKYAVATWDNTTGSLLFEEESLFDKLFTDPNDIDATKPDAVDAVATLNARLSNSYSLAALEQMKKQCQQVATGCVKTMCGTDYENCYRNRTDVYSTLTQTNNASFNKSMNKVGGVLDYTIVIGLCLNTVKANPVCDNHIQAEAARKAAGQATTGVGWSTGTWGDATSARDGWLGSGVYGIDAETTEYQDTDADGNLLCTTEEKGGGQIDRCDDVSGLYIYPYMISETTYAIKQAERTIFRDLVYDLEKEAQAQYNAKLTQQQNMCISSSSGGIGGVVGTKDLAGTFTWVKLRNNKVPANYSVNGLAENQFTSSNELYGSFCRVRVTIQSDDKDIQEAIRSNNNSRTNWSTAYFAVGDAFTCGSWIPKSDLDRISNAVAKRKSGTNADGSLKSGQQWAVAGLSVLGAVGGGLGMEALQKGSLGGLLGTDTTKKTDAQNKLVDSCVQSFNKSIQTLNTTGAVEGKKISIGEYVSGPKSGAYSYTIVNGTKDDKITTEDINAKVTEMQDYIKDVCGKKDDAKSKKGGRIVTNVIGAGIGGTLLGVGSAQIMKANNRDSFNAAQKEWMEEVGDHIRCYIGAEEVGVYGDMLSIELE